SGGAWHRVDRWTNGPAGASLGAGHARASPATTSPARWTLDEEGGSPAPRRRPARRLHRPQALRIPGLLPGPLATAPAPDRPPPGVRGADRGPGRGVFAVRRARAGGRGGRVYAVDVDEAMNESLQERLRRAGIDNVDVILGRVDDPLLPAEGVDLVLVVDTYH